MRDAAFAAGGSTIVVAQNIRLAEGDRLALACSSDRAAAVLAMMAAGLVKASSGRVFVGAFDPRIQPVQVKRIAGFVPYEYVPHDFTSFEHYIEYRAALWRIPTAQAIVRAWALQARLAGVHDAVARPLIGALIAQPRLLVLDRPPQAYAVQILDAAGACAILSTHTSEIAARAFAGTVSSA